MVTVDKAVHARLHKNGKEFEILVDPEAALKAKDALKSGKDVDIASILAIEDVFFDSKKGIRAGKKDLMPAFNTDDVLEAAKIIIKEGKIATTSEQRHKEIQEKLDRITALISTNAVDAKTKLPIPRKTIEDALKQAVFKVDERKVEDQLQDAIKAVKKIIPLSFEERKLQINKLAANVAGRCLETCKNLGTVTKQEWGNDGSMSISVTVPAGLREELMDKINAFTHGNADIKLID